METIDKYFNGLGNYFSKNSADFLNLIPECNQFNVEEIKVIYKALYKAMELHSGQVRKTGDPYINHPIGAASILASYGLDYEVVSAALLHDTIEDTSYTLDDCEKDFGKNIARLVDGATKIGRDVNHYTHKKILDNIKFDARFIAVKAGDRLHNLYTLEALSKNKQKEIALETKCFYVPIAKILGIYKLKDEKLIQITEDQTFIARELALGSITEEEAKVHPKRNTLLECIGVRGKANMIIKKGTVEKDDVFLLCSDGFYHKISKEEIVHNFNSVSNENIINNNISVLVNLAKTRGEIDNISLIVTKIS